MDNPQLVVHKELSQAERGKQTYLLNRATKMKQVYGKGYHLAEVAFQFGVSSSCVMNAIRRYFPSFKFRNKNFRRKVKLPAPQKRVFKGRYKPRRIKNPRLAKKCVACGEKLKYYHWNRFLCKNCSPLSLYAVFTKDGMELTAAGKKKLASKTLSTHTS